MVSDGVRPLGESVARDLQFADLPSLEYAAVLTSRRVFTRAFAKSLDTLWPGAAVRPARGSQEDFLCVELAGPWGLVQLGLPRRLFPLASAADSDTLPGLTGLLVQQAAGEWMHAHAARRSRGALDPEAWRVRHIDEPGPGRTPVHARLELPDAPGVDICIWRAEPEHGDATAQTDRDLGALPSLPGCLPVRCALRLATLALAPRRLRSLRRGDGLLLGAGATGFDDWIGHAILTLAGRPLGSFRARIESGELTQTSNMNSIDDPYDPDLSDENWADDEIDEAEALDGFDESDDSDDSPASGGPALRLDAITVPVHVECDAGELSLAEIGDMRPGYVLELPCALSAAKVRIRVSGRVVGAGQLVAVGDRLAVRLDRIETMQGEQDDVH